MSYLKAIFGDSTVHFEGRRGSRQQARAYCMKEDSRAEGAVPVEIGDWTGPEERARTDLVQAREVIQASESWNAVVNNPEIIKTVARHRNWAREVYENRPQVVEPPEIELRPWEEEVLEIIDGDPIKRLVVWIWSEESGTGKSTFFDYCCHHYNVLPGTDYVNTLYAYDGQSVIWFDLTRDESYSTVPYHAIEKFSNGGFHLSSKYVSVRKHVSCHVVVTANFEPNEQKLPGRCRIIKAITPSPPVPPPSPDLLLDDSYESLGYIDTLSEGTV